MPDIDFLDENWGRLTLSYLPTKLKRTQKAVVLKAKRLGLGASTKADEYLTANQVAVLLNIENHTVLRWIKNYNLRSTRKILLYKRKFHLIKHCDLLRWLKNNQGKFDSNKIDFKNFGYEPLWLKSKRKKDRELPKRRFKKWTDPEIKRIIDLYRDFSYKEIAKIMNRSHNSIDHKFCRLKYKIDEVKKERE